MSSFLVLMRCLAPVLAAAVVTLGVALPAWGQEALNWQALRDGDVVLIRHAYAPGVGDPASFRLDDCGTQRNLDDRGRRQADGIGKAFGQAPLPVTRVLTSRWCRARDTAELAFPGQAVDEPVFDSFFQGRGDGNRQTREAAALLSQWRGPGLLVVVTHQVNISGLTNVFAGSGEAVVVRPEGTGVRVLGRLALP